MKIKSIQPLYNMLYSFSCSTLDGEKGLYLLVFEKADLSSNFDHSKHHDVTAMNILMFLQRKNLVNIDTEKSQGEWVEWNQPNLTKFSQEIIPKVYGAWSLAQTKGASLIEKYG